LRYDCPAVYHAYAAAVADTAADAAAPGGWGLLAGLDVAGLLGQVGLQVTDTSEKVGTFAIAYAAHKALSPVRFPPTVALTPVVAKWIGKDKAAGEGKDANGSSSS
jgi:hypothetical protein